MCGQYGIEKLSHRIKDMPKFKKNAASLNAAKGI